MSNESIPDSALRITSHEVLALLSFNPDPGAELSRKVLALADLPQDSDLVRAGLSTLHVREMAQATGESINLQGGALVLSVILCTARQWFEMTRYGASSSLPVYVVDSPHGKAVIFSQPLSQYLCVPLRGDVDVLAFIAQTVNNAVDEAQAMDGGLITVRNHRTGQSPALANVKVNADGTRQLAAPPVQADGQLTLSMIEGSHSPGAAVAQVFAEGAQQAPKHDGGR